MRFSDLVGRFGLVDVCTLMVLAVIVWMPGKSLHFEPAFAHRNEGDTSLKVDDELLLVGRLQTELLANPADGAKARQMANRLSELGRHDLAMRVAGTSATAAPKDWQSTAGVSAAYADAYDIPNALAWAEKSLETCRTASVGKCARHEELRLRIYVDQLRIGTKLVAEGVDPRLEPDKFRDMASKSTPTMRTGSSQR